jgi:hypothetical protein
VRGLLCRRIEHISFWSFCGRDTSGKSRSRVRGAFDNQIWLFTTTKIIKKETNTNSAYGGADRPQPHTRSFHAIGVLHSAVSYKTAVAFNTFQSWKLVEGHPRNFFFQFGSDLTPGPFLLTIKVRAG